jgi:ferredoxin
MSMKVWIDQDLCVGAGLCENIAPEVFVFADDGLAYTTSGGRLMPTGEAGIVKVAPGIAEKVIDAAEACPAECIYIDIS